MLESEITASILKYLRSLDGCFCWKEHGGPYGTNGIPDIICCRNGKFYAFEVKAAKGKPTKLQEAILRKINAAGGTSLIVRSVDDVRSALGVNNDH